MYTLSDYNYPLPVELIAQKPAARRDQSNLLVMDRRTAMVSHHRFNALDNFLNPSDVLVVNNTAVIPVRLVGKKDSGGKVEVLICSFNGHYKPQTIKKTGFMNVWLRLPNRQERGVYFTLMRG